MTLWGQSSTKPPTSVDELLDPAVRAALIGLDIEARRLLASPRHGERRSTRRGSSVEFADFRPYAPGDDLRRVDWNVYARLDALVVKLFQDEEDLLTVLAVDDSASMVFGEPCKHVFARRLAMCIGIIALSAGHRTSCHALASDAPASQTLRGRGSLGALARWVLDLNGLGRGDLAADLRRLADRIPGRAKLIVLTDGLQQGDALPAALAAVGARGHDTHLVQLLSPQERSPLHTGLTGDHRLVDAETGDGPAISVTASVEAAYQTRLHLHIDMLENACRCSGAHHTLVHTDASIEALLRQRLRRGGLLR
jgi:uncharacterized protein (DUF58 family)